MGISSAAVGRYHGLMYFKMGIGLALFFACAKASPWSGEVIYQIMPDRFYDGDSSNNTGMDVSDPLGWHGGDLSGIAQKLPYIQKLGATAIWLTPIYVQPKTAQFETQGYHGYWPYDLKAIDPHFGTLEDFKVLVKSAHSLGLRVILDQVINHFGYGAPQVAAHPDWFHKSPSCLNLGNAEVNCPLAGLPDLAQENPEVERFLRENQKFWSDLGVDGFRYDALKHVPKTFIQKLLLDSQSEGRFTLGEVFVSSPEVLAEYQALGLDSIFDFPLQEAMVHAIMEGRSLEVVRNVLSKDRVYPRPLDVATFLENHDVPRFASRAPLLSESARFERLAYGLRALMTLRGIPVVYQGLEIGMQGGTDPDNRRDMRFEETWNPNERRLFEVVQSAISARRASSALSEGKQSNVAVPPYLADRLLLFTRESQSENMLVVWHSGSERTTFSIPFSDQWKPARDVFGQDAKMGTSGGFLHLSIPPKTAVAFRIVSP